MLYSGCDNVEKPMEKQVTETEAVEKEKNLDEIIDDFPRKKADLLAKM